MTTTARITSTGAIYFPQFTPTEHEKAEWSRMAQAAYSSGRNATGNRYSVAASIPRGAWIGAAQYDALQAAYRKWLAFNEWPQS